jgi:hypothetical protein
MTGYQCHTNDDEQAKCVMLASNVTWTSITTRGYECLYNKNLASQRVVWCG